MRDNIDGPSYEDFIRPTCEPILQWWKGKRLSEVNKATCDAYVQWRTSQHRKLHPNSKKRPKKISLATARHDLKSFRAAINHYKAAYDPALVVPTVTILEKPEPKMDYFLTRDEVARRLNIARKDPLRKHLCRFLLIGIYSGTRPGNILSLRWLPSPTAGYINLDTETLHRAGADERRTKKRKPRARIHRKLLPHLKRWHRMDAKLGISHVVHFEGEPIKSIKRTWRSVGGGKDGPHIVRHTAATWTMQSRNVDIYEAAGWLGMSPETLADVYGHQQPRPPAERCQRFSQATRQAIPKDGSLISADPSNEQTDSQ